MHTHSQFLMPGLVDCHLHPTQYIDAGKEPTATFGDFVANTIIPTDVEFRNITFAREASLAIVVSSFYIQHCYVHLENGRLCVTYKCDECEDLELKTLCIVF